MLDFLDEFFFLFNKIVLIWLYSFSRTSSYTRISKELLTLKSASFESEGAVAELSRILLGQMLPSQALLLGHFFLAACIAEDFAIAVLDIVHVAEHLLFGTVGEMLFCLGKLFPHAIIEM